jgi:hypothetical protein
MIAVVNTFLLNSDGALISNSVNILYVELIY